MKVILVLFCLIFISYNCSPINKQHGYLLEDVISSSDQLSQFNPGATTQDDVFTALGSPSIKISDINNIWIYLISLKEKNVFENDNIVFQSIIRFEFNEDGVLSSKNFISEENFTEIAFSKDKTKVIEDTYGIVDQIYESFTRGQ